MLWYDSPAETFTQALPLGNGSLGAMCYGAVGLDRIRLNDETAWSGSIDSELASSPQSAELNQEGLRRARASISAGHYQDAAAALAPLTQPHTQAYLPFADLLLEITGTDGATNYRRSLDLRTATHSHCYDIVGGRVEQSVFISAAAAVMVIELSISTTAGSTLCLDLDSQLKVSARVRGSDELGLLLQLPCDVAPTHATAPTAVTYSSDAARSLQGAAVLGWEHDGLDRPDDRTLSATGVHLARIVVSTATTFTALGQPASGTAHTAHDRARSCVRRALLAGVPEITAAHLADHAALYDRVDIALVSPQTTPRFLPTDQRVTASPDDPALAALLFNFGRYLLISSSRAGGLPATLQGLWNEQMQPPWSCNYTVNINTQMNYWAAESVNLAQSHEPLFDLVDALAIRGTTTAQRLYGARGWVTHHNTDAWAFTSPVAGDASWSFWPLAPAWLATHLWEHVRYGGDAEFAAKRAWPVIRSACEFFLEWLVRQPDGTLGTVPSTSPENHFVGPDGRIAAAARSSTADIAMIAHLFEAALALGPAGDDIVKRVVGAASQLPPIPIAPDGSVQEWADAFDEAEPHHRHVSPLYFAYPGDTPLPPALATAVSTTLDKRGDDSAGWSLVWKIALRARLAQPKAVERLLPLLFRSAGTVEGPWAGGLYPNLFAAHPPFQIDANLGFVAALVECLVQSHGPAITLLPSVPRRLGNGSVSGLVIRPGVFLDLEWASTLSGEVRLVRAGLCARTKRNAGDLRVCLRGVERLVSVTETEQTVMTESDFAS
jgi:alpha-L-fucosidase 2